MENLEEKSGAEYFGKSSAKERIFGIYRATKRAFQELVNVCLGVEYAKKEIL